MRRALITFLAIDALIVAAGLAGYMLIMRPRVREIESARDQAVRANVAMTARVHAIEGRLALNSGDVAGARHSADDLLASLDGLVKRSPEGRERSEVLNLRERAMLVQTEVESDQALARSDFELLDAKLAALYPVATK
jgi:hypothetical protein